MAVNGPPRTVAAACAQIAHFYGTEDQDVKIRSCLWWMNRGVEPPRRIQKEEVLGSPACMHQAIQTVMKHVDSLDNATYYIKKLYFQCLVSKPQIHFEVREKVK